MAVADRPRERGRFDATTSAGRAVRYGSNTLIMTIALIGVLVLINVIAARVDKRWDLTAEGRFSLSPQTGQILSGLKAPVKVTGFFAPGDPGQSQAEDLLKEYALASNGKLTYELVDPEQQPALARQLGITSYGSLVFQQGDRKQIVFASDEQGLTGALLKVTSDKQKTVYFLTGHGEPAPDDFSGRGFSTWRDTLQHDNYNVATLNLAITTTVPSDAAVVVVAAPQKPLSADELTHLQDWLDGGGSALVLAGPQADPSVQSLLEPWQVRLGDGVVVDPAASFLGDVATPVITRYPFHDITRDLGGLTSFFPFARPVVSDNPNAQTLVSTSPQSWAETDLQSRQVQFNEGKDTRGPLNLAVALERTSGQSDTGTANESPKQPRLVVFGNTDFVSNQVLSTVRGAFGNVDLAVNAVNWLAADEALIAIRTTPDTPRQVILTGPQSSAIFYGTTIAIPLLVLLAGGWVWWRRR
ncbi:MAG: GldG family protein [Ardenticatenaceae bacterium]|nr:GldG family protein [Ardenticatenaceae bacterium]HBY98444.1 hypothetical protein [Chloroflexota bacterium]